MLALFSFLVLLDDMVRWGISLVEEVPTPILLVAVGYRRYVVVDMELLRERLRSDRKVNVRCR